MSYDAQHRLHCLEVLRFLLWTGGGAEKQIYTRDTLAAYAPF